MNKTTPLTSSYENKLLDGWEEVYKKGGQMTLWTLLALKDGSKDMGSIKQFIENHTGGTLEADDQSMYRALRRYYSADMVAYDLQPNQGGPDKKLYRLTSVGQAVLQAFIKRNILDVYYRPEVMQLFKEDTR